MSSQSSDKELLATIPAILQRQQSLEKVAFDLRALTQSCLFADDGDMKGDVKAITRQLSSEVNAMGSWFRENMSQDLVAKTFGDERQPPSKVLSIPELLEHILLNLSICDLRKAMRVNRCF